MFPDGKLNSFGSPDQFPVDEDVLKDKRSADRGNGEVMAFQSEQMISDDKLITEGDQDSDGHGNPEGDFPPDHH